MGAHAPLFDRLTGTQVSAKFAPVGSADAARLVREAAVHAGLRHPYLAEFAGPLGPTAESEGVAIRGFTTRWVDGPSLGAWAPTVPLERRLDQVARLASAVAYLHRCGVLHLDLKPSNAIVPDDDRIALLDLGSARPVTTGPGPVGGTVGFAAPEVLEGAAPTEAADVYGIAALLYEVVTGVAPFRGVEGAAIRAAQLAGPPSIPAAAGLPSRLRSLLERALDPDPLNRPRQMTDVLDALDAAGHRAPRYPGDPPFVGREREVPNLVDLVRSTEQPVAVLGSLGSGRRRLARAALLPLSDHHEVVDLSDASAWRDALARCGPGVVALLGDDGGGAPDDDRAQIAAASDRGVRVIAVRSRCPQGFRAFHLPPLPESAMEAIAGFAGLPPSAHRRSRIADAAGSPGPLVDQAAPQALLDALPAGAREGLGILRALPAGVPLTLARRLPTVRDALDSLGRAGLAHTRSGACFVPMSAPPAPLPGHTVATLLREGVTADRPLWTALTWRLLDDDIQARALLPAVLDETHAPTAEHLDLCRWLGARGHGAAWTALARLEIRNGRGAEALTALEQAPGGVERSRLEARAAWLTGDLERAERAALRAADGAADPQAWCLLAAVRQRAGRLAEASAALDHAEHADPTGACAAQIAGWRLSVAMAGATGDRDRIDPALLDAVSAHPDASQLPAETLSQLGRLALREGRVDDARRLGDAAATAARLSGEVAALAYTQLHAGNLALRVEDPAAARACYVEALQAARSGSLHATQIRCLYSLAELEVRCGRLTQAEHRIQEFADVAGTDAEAGPRLVLLRAALATANRDWLGAIAQARAIDPAHADPAVALGSRLILAEALAGAGQLEEAARALDGVPEPAGGRAARVWRYVHGRVLLARGAALLAHGVAGADPGPGAIDRDLYGRIAMSAASRDLDPARILEIRSELDTAASMLDGEVRRRAADLRDAIATGPGARLDAIARLMETIRRPTEFPSALAALVAEALGANRVLIMVRIPGHGRNVTFRELTEAEATGLSVEILKRIRAPDDVWLAVDAVDDPHLRSISATVRTLSIRSVVAVALPVGDRAVGALYVDDVHRRGRFDAEHVALLQRLARAAAGLLDLMSPSAQQGPSQVVRRLGVVLRDANATSELDLAVERARATPEGNLLITGATGTGKTWLARQIATDVLGTRGLVEATMRRFDVSQLVGMLAGTRLGDFTGAVRSEGLIRRCLAEGKALFLDEIQALGDAEQVALLPLLEQPQRRFGGLSDAATPIDGRLPVILGTNVSPTAWRSHFREDFWFRISANHVHLPSLAERGPEVVGIHLDEMLEARGVSEPQQALEPAARQALTGRAWEGNLRELASAADRVAHALRINGGPLALGDLTRLHLLTGDEPPPPSRPTTPHQAFLEEVLALLPRHGWNQSAVARELGTTPSRVHRALKRGGALTDVLVNKVRQPP